MANPAFRSSTNVTSTSPTFSVSKPAGTVDGDLLVAFEASAIQTGGTPPATPTGWTAFAGATIRFGLSGVIGLSVFYKSASGEPANWTFNNATGGAGNQASVYVICVQNAPAAPNTVGSNVVAAANGTGTTADPTAVSSLITPDANDLVLTAWADDVGSGSSPTITPDASYTALGIVSGVAYSFNAGYKSVASAGTVANNSASLSGTTPHWGASAVTVSPAGSVTSSPPAGPPYPGLPPAVLTL
jgi:hypothetical protein